MKKKIVSLLLCIAMLAVLVPATALFTAAEDAIAYDTSWYKEAEATLYIEDAADLLGFSYLLSQEPSADDATKEASAFKFNGKTIVLNADIDLNPGWNAASGSVPTNVWLAGNNHGFTGTFDGNGHTISGIYLNVEKGEYVGILGTAKGGTEEKPVTVKNFAIVNSYVKNHMDDVVRKTGSNGNDAAEVTNCLGGIFGGTAKTEEATHVLIDGVYVDANIVVSNNKTGGAADVYAGGFVGLSNPSAIVTIQNSVFAGEISTNGKDQRSVAGFIGCADAKTTVTFKNCAFTGAVRTGGNRVSGFIGFVIKSPSKILIENCLEAGDVSPASWAAKSEWNSSFFGAVEKASGNNSAASETVTIKNSVYTDTFNKTNEPAKAPVPVNGDNTIPIQENLVYVSDEGMEAFGDAANAAFTKAGMTEWTITEKGLIVPKALEELVNHATKDQELPPKPTDAWKELFQKQTFTAASGATLNYRLYIPEDYDASKTYPVVLFLHGEDERGDDNEAQLMKGLTTLFADEESLIYRCIVVAPQCPADQKWVNVEKWTDCKYSTKSIPESAILAATLELLDSLKTTYSVDSNRMYATGISMGGFGTWDLIVRHADKFAAVIPICGGCDSSAAEQLVNVPIWTFHGLSDTVVPPAGTADMVVKIRRASGTLVRYEAMADKEHSIWNSAYATEGLLNWLLDQTLENRVPLPGNENEAPGPAESTEPTGEPSDSTDPTGADPSLSNASTGCRSTAGTSLIPLLVLGCAIALWHSKKIIVTGFAKTQN